MEALHDAPDLPECCHAFQYGSTFQANGLSQTPSTPEKWPGEPSHRPVFFNRAPLLLLLAVLSIFLQGCITLNDPETSQEYRTDVVALISPDQVVGQSFIPHRVRLNRITVWLRLETDAQVPANSLVAELYDSHLPTSPLESVTIPLGSQSTQEVNINFGPLSGTPGQSYYLALRLKSGAIQVLGRDEDAYPGGQAFANQQPLDADISFRLGYDYDLAAMLADLMRALQQAPLGIALLFTLWLPGRLLLDLLRPRQRLDWGERVALSVGMSMAVIPLFFTWTTVFGLHWTRAGIWGVIIVLWAVLLWRARPVIYRFLAASEEQQGAPRGYSLKPPRLRPDPASLALGAVFLVSLAVRMAQARDLSAPPWVDSVHHAMIIRLFLENGAFPDNFFPYVKIAAANYHTGFHSIAAVYQWLSGTDLARGLLLFGQVLNALSVFAVYLFTTTFTRSRWAGVFAAFITGLLTPMPAYYTSWGRYTQLAGLLVLPVAFFWLRAFYEPQTDGQLGETGRKAWKQPLMLAAAAAIAASGLFLIHLRVIAFLALLLAVDWIASLLPRLRQPGMGRATLRQIGWLLAAALLAGVFTSPWLPGIISSLVLPRISWKPDAVGPFRDFAWGYLTTAYGRQALALAGAGIVLAIVKRRQFPIVLVAWIAILLLMPNLSALGLPGGGFINTTSVAISLFMPVSVLGGYLLGWLVQFWPVAWPLRGRPAYFAGWLLAAMVVAVLGARALLTLLNPVTMLFREADRPAIQWIDANLPKDARILINPFSWGYGIYAGQDGGAWIVPLALRETFPPPVLYGLSNSSEQVTHISGTMQAILNHYQDPEALRGILLDEGIDYVYTGGRGGMLSPELLRYNLGFELVHAENGTYLFRVVPFHDPGSPDGLPAENSAVLFSLTVRG